MRQSKLFVAATLIAGALAINIAGQGDGRVPRVGLIKDYPATGLTAGCGNLYFTFPSAKGDGSDYVFLSRGDGGNAWMNMSGRDTHLKYITQETFYSTGEEIRFWRYTYRAGATKIAVSIRHNPDTSNDAAQMLMTITVSRGRSSRRLSAIGSSDC